MGACEAACCGDEKGNFDTQQLSGHQINQVSQDELRFLLTHVLIVAHQKPFSQANLFELVIKDEK